MELGKEQGSIRSTAHEAKPSGSSCNAYLKENDWFTFRTGANITDLYSDDVLFKVDGEFSTEDSCQKVNCMSCGGAQFLIRNKRSIVWKVLIDEIERCLL